MPLYFAYGSNMCAAQMARRCPGALALGVGLLEGYTLRFPRRGAIWDGGIADVTPSPGDRVFGVRYEISDEELAVLDTHEVSYRRELLPVRAWVAGATRATGATAPAGGPASTAAIAPADGPAPTGPSGLPGTNAPLAPDPPAPPTAVYLINEPLGHFVPHDDYLARMVRGAREAGVPVGYLRFLRSAGRPTGGDS